MTASDHALSLIRANYEVEELSHNRVLVEVETPLGKGQLVTVDHNPDFVFFESEIAKDGKVEIERLLRVCEENSTLGLLRLDGVFVLRHVVSADELTEDNVQDAFILTAINAQHISRLL